MTSHPQPPRVPRNVDAEHLRILSIFHFVGAGLAVVGLLFLLAHFAIFQSVLANPKVWENQKQNPPPAEIFAILKWFYLIFAVWFVCSGVLNLLSGLFIRSRRHRTFSLVVSGINCLHVPLGTVLGVFTIVVLIRDSVRELYDSDARAALSGAAAAPGDGGAGPEPGR